MKPLDQIPELVGAGYSVTMMPAFILDGILYTVITRQLRKSQIIDLVGRHGPDLWVFSCQQGEPITYFSSCSNRRGECNNESSYFVKYAVAKDLVASYIRLQIRK